MRLAPAMRLAIILAATMLVGCATPPKFTGRTSARVNAPMDQVWSALVSEVGLNYPIQAIEKDSGLISTDYVSIPPSYIGHYCNAPSGGNFLSVYNPVRMNLRILAVEASGGVDVRINAHYEAFDMNALKQWLTASSTGAIEDEILRSIGADRPSAPPMTFEESLHQGR